VNGRFTIRNSHMHVQSEDEISPSQQLHVADNFLITLPLSDQLVAPVGKRVRPHRGNLQFATSGQTREATTQGCDVRSSVINIATNFRPQLDDRLMHFRFDLFFERDFATFQNFMNVRAEMSRFWIDDGKLFLDPESKDVIVRAH